MIKSNMMAKAISQPTNLMLNSQQKTPHKVSPMIELLAAARSSNQLRQLKLPIPSTAKILAQSKKQAQIQQKSDNRRSPMLRTQALK